MYRLGLIRPPEGFCGAQSQLIWHYSVVSDQISARFYTFCHRWINTQTKGSALSVFSVLQLQHPTSGTTVLSCDLMSISPGFSKEKEHCDRILLKYNVEENEVGSPIQRKRKKVGNIEMIYFEHRIQLNSFGLT